MAEVVPSLCLHFRNTFRSVHFLINFSAAGTALSPILEFIGGDYFSALQESVCISDELAIQIR